MSPQTSHKNKRDAHHDIFVDGNRIYVFFDQPPSTDWPQSKRVAGIALIIEMEKESKSKKLETQTSILLEPSVNAEALKQVLDGSVKNSLDTFISRELFCSGALEVSGTSIQITPWKSRRGDWARRLKTRVQDNVGNRMPDRILGEGIAFKGEKEGDHLERKLRHGGYIKVAYDDLNKLAELGFILPASSQAIEAIMQIAKGEPLEEQASEWKAVAKPITDAIEAVLCRFNTKQPGR